MTPDSLPLRLLLASPDMAETIWWRLDDGGRIVDRGRVREGARLPEGPATRDVLVLPGSDVGSRWLEVQARNEIQATAAARAMLVDMLASGTCELHVVLEPAATGGGRRHALFVGHDVLARHLAHARGIGAAPVAALPDYMLVPASDDGAIRVTPFEGRWLARGTGLSFACEPGLAAVLLDGRDAVMLAPDAAEATLAHAAVSPPVDLLQGPFALDAGQARRPRWRRSAVLAALVALSPLVLTAVDAARHAIAAAGLRDEAAATARRAVPGHGEGDDPVAAMQAAATSSRGFAAMAAPLFEALAARPGLRLERLDYDAGSGLQARIAHPAGDDLAPLADALAASGFHAEITAAEGSGGTRVATLRVSGGVR